MKPTKRQHIEAAVKQLKALNAGDPEVAHLDADSILVAFLRSTGAGAVADAFEDASSIVGFEYS